MPAQTGAGVHPGRNSCLSQGHRIASGVTETEYTDCGRYKNYYYAVTAVNAEGESDPSNEAQASEPCGSAMAMTLPVLNAAALTRNLPCFPVRHRNAQATCGVIQRLSAAS